MSYARWDDKRFKEYYYIVLDTCEIVTYYYADNIKNST